MQRVRGWLMAGVVMCTLAGMMARADDEKEEKIPLDKVPKAVLKAVKAKFKDAKLVSAQKENENGKLAYEINLKHKGAKIEVTVTPDGKIVSVEKTIAVKALPKPVTEAVNRKYPRAKYMSVEEVSADGKTSYEVLIATAEKKTFEVVLDKSGKIIKEARVEIELEKK
ncbi:MAG TPA: PepSY-like domain-containing protein [Gemmataceae bacterium]|nr:PepSY-like domain-containing protein [Gemmataceae bacterium]